MYSTTAARAEAHEDALASGDPSEPASGNGSVMRLAPVPVAHAGLYPDKRDELSRPADESGLPTHASEPCRSACRYLATVPAACLVLMAGVLPTPLRGAEKENSLMKPRTA